MRGAKGRGAAILKESKGAQKAFFCLARSVGVNYSLFGSMPASIMPPVVISLFVIFLLGNSPGVAQGDAMVARAVRMDSKLAARDGFATFGEDGWEYLTFDRTSPQREYAIEKQNIMGTELVNQALLKRGEVGEDTWKRMQERILRSRAFSAQEFLERCRALETGGIMYRFCRCHKTDKTRIEEGLMVVKEGQIVKKWSQENQIRKEP